MSDDLRQPDDRPDVETRTIGLSAAPKHPTPESLAVAHEWRVRKRHGLTSDEQYEHDFAILLDAAHAKEADVARKIAMTTPFRAHAQDDVDFDSGCVQTRDRIVKALDERIAHWRQP